MQIAKQMVVRRDQKTGQECLFMCEYSAYVYSAV